MSLSLFRIVRNSFFNVILFILVSDILYSQKLEISVGSGLGSYRMADLKELNLNNLNSLSFNARQLDDYPSYLNYQSSLLFSLKELVAFGVSFSYASTGSRISRSDYSGEYQFDTKIRGLSPGVILELYMPVNKFIISFRNEAGFEYSKLWINEYLRIRSDSEELEYKFTAKNSYYEPSIRLSYPVWLFRASVSAGYLLELKKRTLLSTSANNFAINLPSGEKAASDWSGVRVGLSFSFNILQFWRSMDKPTH